MKWVAWFVAYFAVAAAVAVGAAPARAPEKPPLQHAMLGVANGCFVETVAFLDHWKEANGGDAWARLLQWGAREDEEVVMGHAVAICEARGALWSWDINFGWSRLAIEPAQKERAEMVAAPVVKKYPRVSPRFPTYRFDFPQPPSANPPVARLTATQTTVRDASLVGEKLARYRPVNVVRFDYEAAPGEKRESAVAVFVFHGRYCVYSPEHGTVPFRVRTGVENLRTIQELLRRMFPGVTGVRKL
jgi:hypothetical protein